MAILIMPISLTVYKISFLGSHISNKFSNRRYWCRHNPSRQCAWQTDKYNSDTQYTNIFIIIVTSWYQNFLSRGEQFGRAKLRTTPPPPSLSLLCCNIRWAPSTKVSPVDCQSSWLVILEEKSALDHPCSLYATVLRFVYSNTYFVKSVHIHS